MEKLAVWVYALVGKELVQSLFLHRHLIYASCKVTLECDRDSCERTKVLDAVFDQSSRAANLYEARHKWVCKYV